MGNKFLTWMISQIKTIFSLRFILNNILIPIGLLIIYFYISSLFLPAGVNKIFVSKAKGYFILLYIILSFFFLIFYTSGKHKVLREHEKNNSYLDFILLLLPLTPVAQYLLLNRNILSWYHFIFTLCFFLLLTSIPIIVIPLFFRNFDCYRSITAMGVAFSSTITFMVTMSEQFHWHKAGLLDFQVPILCIIWFICWLAFRIKARIFLYGALIVFFISNSVLQMVSISDEHSSQISAKDIAKETNEKFKSLSYLKKPIINPDIFMLVYDSYVNVETLKAYGIGHHSQEEYLKNLGFKIYPHNYTIAPITLESMSRVLNMTNNVGDDVAKRKIVSGEGLVPKLLKKYGYQTYGIFPTDYEFRGVHASYDYYYPPESTSLMDFPFSILTGEFEFDLNFANVSHEDYVNTKEWTFSQPSNSPRFIYSHSDLPSHSQISGECEENELEQFDERLKTANLEMRNDVDTIISNNPNALIIIAGDHGPHLTKNCFDTGSLYDISQISRLDIQDRYGAFLAIKWPFPNYEDYDEISTLQDIFPVVLAYIFNDKKPLDYRISTDSLMVREFISNANVRDGIIQGGVNDGEPLFVDKVP